MTLGDAVGGETDLCLVTMPFVDLFRPSIALGLLKSTLRPIPCRTTLVYANLLFAERIGLDNYVLQRLASPLLQGGEWLFAEAAFPEHRTDLNAFAGALAREVLKAGQVESTPARQAWMSNLLLDIRRAATVFVDDLATALLAAKPSIVACTSTFQQHLASLALLRKVKERQPAVVTMLGGANCAAEMGVANAEAFPWLDLVFSGEADAAFAPLVDRILSHGLAQVAADPPIGAILQGPPGGGPGETRRYCRNAVLPQIDTAADPDYTDYFATLRRLSFHDRIIPSIPLESSRGCWWGQKNGCTFCGLNGRGLSYRSKDPDRVVREIEGAATRYQVDRIEFVDNILDMHYFKTVLPRLAEAGSVYNIFMETKANLTRPQVRALRAAGVRWIQPGIEGLHDRMLSLMNKGTDTATNLQLLKYGAEFGVRMTWHILVGFPGEQDDWHRDCASRFSLLHHLNPPTGLIPIIFQRFSAFHEQPEHYGLKLRVPACLHDIYPLPEAQLERLSYYFDDDSGLGDRLRSGAGYAALRAAVGAWRDSWRLAEIPPLLAMTDDGDTIAILDTRACAIERRQRLTGVAADVLRACEPAVTRARLPERIRRSAGREWPDALLDAAIHELTASRLLVAVSDRLLSLPIPGDIPDLPTPQEFPGGLDRPTPVAVLMRRALTGE